MSKDSVVLKDLEFFASLTPKELDAVTATMHRQQVEAGAAIFMEGEPGGGLYVVLDGVVDIATRVVGDVEKRLLTVRSGSVFGELSLVSGEARTATARARTDTTLMSLTSAAYEDLVRKRSVIGKKLTRQLLDTVVGRLSVTTELYRQAVAWGLRISGIIEMNFDKLIAENVHIHVELATGKSIAGTLLKAEKSPVGYELLLMTDDEQFAIVPYQSVVTISFDADAAKPQAEALLD